MKKILLFIMVLCLIASSGACSKSHTDIDRPTSHNQVNDDASAAHADVAESETNEFGTEENSDIQNTKETTTVSGKDVTDAENTTRADKLDSKQEYKKYFYNKFTGKDSVYLIDLTHDGIDDMLICKNTDEYGYSDLKIRLFTLINGEVKEIYSRKLHAFRTKVMLTSPKGKSNLLIETTGIYQGGGTLHCEEFYVENSGNTVMIRDILKENITENDIGAYDEYYNETEKHYGEGLSKVYLYPTGDINSHNLILNTSPSAVFGENSAVSDDNVSVDAIYGTWKSVIQAGSDKMTLILYIGKDGTAEYKYGFYNSELLETYAGQWSEKNGVLSFDLTGGTGFEDENGSVQIHNKNNKYKWETDDGKLILNYVDGSPFFSYNGDETVYVFEPM